MLSLIKPRSHIWAITNCILLSFLYIIFIRYLQPSLNANTGVILSFLGACISSVPLIIYLYNVGSNYYFKLLIISWILIKLIFLYLAPPENVAMGTSDWSAFYDIGVNFYNYWKSGGDIIIGPEIFNLYYIKYPLAPYIFAPPMLIFGPYSYVIVPWLGLIQLIIAVYIYKLFKLTCANPIIPQIGIVFALYSPSLLYYTNMLFRDIYIQLGLLLVLYGMVIILFKRTFPGVLYILLGTFLTVFLREQYFLLIIVFIAIGSFYAKNIKIKNIVPILLGLLLLTYIINTYIFPTRGDIIERTFSSIENSTAAAYSTSASYAQVLSRLSFLSIPIAIPLRLLLGIVAPFPWINTNIPISSQLGESNLYVFLHIAQSIIHLAMLFSILKITYNLIQKRIIIPKPMMLMLLLFYLIVIVGVSSYVGFNRNIITGFIFIIPIIVIYYNKHKFRNLIQNTVIFLVTLHIVYYIVYSIIR